MTDWLNEWNNELINLIFVVIYMIRLSWNNSETINKQNKKKLNIVFLPLFTSTVHQHWPWSKPIMTNEPGTLEVQQVNKHSPHNKKLEHNNKTPSSCISKDD